MRTLAVRGVLFDAGNTLIRVRGRVGGIYAEVARRHGVTVDGAALEQEFYRQFAATRADSRERLFQQTSPEREKRWWQDLVERVFRHTGSWEAVEEVYCAYFEELYAEFERPELWHVFSDVRPCLAELARRGLPVAVVSNWDRRLPGLLAGLGLAQCFRFILTSAEFGAEKPHRSIFRAAADRLGVAPREVLHVGDLYEDDLRGAEQAGLQAILLDRSGTETRSGRRIRGLRELAPLLDSD